MRNLRFLTAGESHGPGLVVTVDGLPAGLAIDVARIDDMLRRCDFPTTAAGTALPATNSADPRALANAISLVENFHEEHRDAVRGVDGEHPAEVDVVDHSVAPALEVTALEHAAVGKDCLDAENLRAHRSVA